MKRIFIFFIIFIYSCSYSQPTQEWAKTYRTRGTTIALDSLGNIILSGFRDSVISTVKFSSSGQIIWSRDTVMYPPGYGIINAVDRHGNVYVTLQADFARFHLIKYDSSGQQIWSRVGFPEYDQCYGMALDTAGNIFVTCESMPGSQMEYLTMKYNPSGEMVWYKRYGGNYGARAPSSIFVDIAGNVYVTGASNIDTIRYYDYATIKYNNDGLQQWISFYNGSISGWDKAYSIYADNNNHCYVTGSSDYTLSRATCATIKYNNSGDSIWTRLYPNDTTGELYLRIGNFIFVDSPGNVYVAGWKYIVASTDGWAITAMKYDKDGNLKWYKTDSAARYSKSAVLDRNNNFYVIGDGNTYMEGVGYDSSGNLIWEFRHSKMNYGAIKILCNNNGDIYLLSSSLDTSMLYKFSVPTGIRNENSTAINQYILEQNYPNPFNQSTVIKFQCPFKSNVTIKIYDVLGREVRTLLSAYLNSGNYQVRFDGEGLSSSIYFYSLYINNNLFGTKQMLMIK